MVEAEFSQLCSIQPYFVAKDVKLTLGMFKKCTVPMLIQFKCGINSVELQK